MKRPNNDTMSDDIDTINTIKKQRIDNECNLLCDLLTGDILNREPIDYIIVNNKKIKLNISNKYYPYDTLEYNFLSDITTNIINNNNLNFTSTEYDKCIEDVIWSTVCNTLLNKKLISTNSLIQTPRYTYLLENNTNKSNSELHKIRNMMLLTINEIFYQFINQYKMNFNILDINFNIDKFNNYSDSFNAVLINCKEYINSSIIKYNINLLSKLNNDDLILSVNNFKNDFINNPNLKIQLEYLFEPLAKYKIMNNNIIIQDYIGSI